MRPKIAVVRGDYFSEDEFAFYEPLKDEFDITFLSSKKGATSRGANPAVRKVTSMRSILNRIHPSVGGLASGLCGNLTGVDPEYVFNLDKTLKAFDMVQTMDYDYALTYRLAQMKERAGFKLSAIHWENIPFARDGKALCRFMKYRTYPKVDGFFAMSERAKASLMLEGVDHSRISVIGWGVDTERFKPDPELGKTWRKRFGIGEDELVILFVGRIRASKGVFELLYAVKRLVEDAALGERRLRVVIAGRGPREKQVVEMSRKLGLGAHVLLTGFVRHDDIQGLHNLADIFCLPSLPRKYWQEQLGMVFIEAMACGKPVVSTLSGSIPEVIGDSGLLVQPNDHLALYEGLKQLVSSREARQLLGTKGRRRVLDHFTIHAISENIRQAFKTILKDKM